MIFTAMGYNVFACLNNCFKFCISEGLFKALYIGLCSRSSQMDKAMDTKVIHGKALSFGPCLSEGPVNKVKRLIKKISSLKQGRCVCLQKKF